MTERHKTILWMGIIVFVLMGLFPPVKHYIGPGICCDDGYGFIFNISGIGIGKGSKRIDARKLLIQWSMAVVITGGFLVTLKGDKKN